MKKRLFLVGLLATVLLFGACTDDEKALFNHPYRMQGELDPSFRVPIISSGQLNFNDLLSSFDGTFTGAITSDNVITFHYDTSIRETIIVGGLITQPANRTARHAVKRHTTKTSSTPFISRDTVITYTIPIDLFDKADMQSIVDGNISIGEILVNLGAFINGGCPPNVDSALRAYVSARFDSIFIDYQAHDYSNHTFSGFASQSLELNDIIAGGMLQFDSINVAEIVNWMPRSITAGFRMHLDVDSAIVEDQLGAILSNPSAINSFHELLDSLRMTWLTFGADLAVNIPFEIRIGNLEYTYELELNGNGDTSQSVLESLDTMLTRLLGDGAVNLDSSHVTAFLTLENDIPFNLRINGTLVDENGVPLYLLLADTTIAAAQIAPIIPGSNIWESVGPTRTCIELPLTVEALEKMTQASKLKLNLSIATSVADNHFVRVKRTDYLKIKLGVQLSPNIKIDMPLFDGFGNIFGGGNNNAQ